MFAFFLTTELLYSLLEFLGRRPVDLRIIPPFVCNGLPFIGLYPNPIKVSISSILCSSPHSCHYPKRTCFSYLVSSYSYQVFLSSFLTQAKSPIRSKQLMIWQEQWTWPSLPLGNKAMLLKYIKNRFTSTRTCLPPTRIATMRTVTPTKLHPAHVWTALIVDMSSA